MSKGQQRRKSPGRKPVYSQQQRSRPDRRMGARRTGQGPVYEDDRDDFDEPAKRPVDVPDA